MKIDTKVIPGEVPFGSLKAGDPFLHRDMVMMKIAGQQWNATKLDDGVIFHFLAAELVRPLKLVVTEDRE